MMIEVMEVIVVTVVCGVECMVVCLFRSSGVESRWSRRTEQQNGAAEWSSRMEQKNGAEWSRMELS